ncbi:MAG: FAD-dependent oxidoreductase [Euryarchaeota archaeon]|nr:FAD-dependent oxidoreductase [Euryarchaeota archaeon]
MERVLILGAGSAGVMLANRLAGILEGEAEITVVEKSVRHAFQPGFLLVPFGIYSARSCTRRVEPLLRPEVRLLRAEVQAIDPPNREVAAGEQRLGYDFLVIATGCRPAFEEVAGIEKELHSQVHEFYTLEGARRLRRALLGMSSGRLVVSVAGMPVKCPGAPLSFAFLAREFFRRRGREVEVVLTTSEAEVFSKPEVAKMLLAQAEERGVELLPDFPVEEVDAATRRVLGPRGDLGYDLLVLIPPHLGAEAVMRSGMGDALGYVPVDRHLLRTRGYGDVYALGDAAALPTSKTASAAHFQARVVAQNLAGEIAGCGAGSHYGGEALCFILTGFAEALVVGFDYKKSYEGRAPLPLLGPLHFNRITRLNHAAKLLSRWLYWHLWLWGEDFAAEGWK